MQVHVGCIISCIWNIWILKSNGESFFAFTIVLIFSSFCVECVLRRPHSFLRKKEVALVYYINGMGSGEGQAMSVPCIALVYSVILDSLRLRGLYPARLLCPWDSPGKDTVVGCHFLLQGIFPTQESNPCPLYPCTSCTGRRVLYHEYHLGSPCPLHYPAGNPSVWLIWKISCLT